MAKNLKLWNLLFYGEQNYTTHKREDGLYSISEQRLGGHTFKSRVAFGILEDAAKNGTNLKHREKERAFLISDNGKLLCKFLKLDYNTVIKSIEAIWNKENEKMELK